VVAWGRHVREKGFDLLLAAWPTVRDALPEATLLLGGDGPETSALRSNPPAGVTFVGALERRQVSDCLARARVAVVPSRLEPFGIVALEAMASGRPVVWSTRGGMGEAMGSYGWPVDPLDRDALAGSIVESLRSETDPAELRRHALQFSWDELSLRYLAVYDAVGARS
jgi:glycosyltransferase involved in cell wall biosynthesis